MTFLNWLTLWLKWFAFLIINLTTNLLSFPLAPFVVLFADKQGWLPIYLWWFQTPDNSLDGDKDWQTLYRPYRAETNRYQRWINRIYWLWRNRLCGFSQSVLGIQYNAQTDTITWRGDLDIGNGPGAKAGWFFKTVKRGNRIIAFQWYWIRQYKARPQSCIRVLIGWKCPRPGDPDKIASFGFSPSPLMHFNS